MVICLHEDRFMHLIKIQLAQARLFKMGCMPTSGAAVPGPKTSHLLELPSFGGVTFRLRLAYFSPGDSQARGTSIRDRAPVANCGDLEIVSFYGHVFDNSLTAAWMANISAHVAASRSL
jgi:hypothetical protein